MIEVSSVSYFDNGNGNILWLHVQCICIFNTTESMFSVQIQSNGTYFKFNFYWDSCLVPNCCFYICLSSLNISLWVLVHVSCVLHQSSLIELLIYFFLFSALSTDMTEFELRQLLVFIDIYMSFMLTDTLYLIVDSFKYIARI